MLRQPTPRLSSERSEQLVWSGLRLVQEADAADLVDADYCSQEQSQKQAGRQNPSAFEIIIDIRYLRDYFDECLERGDVKRLRLALVLFLTAAAVCASVVPRPDLPETAFNEADAPVNLAPPVLPRIQIILPAVNPLAILPLRNHCADCTVRRLLLEPPVAPSQRHSRSLQDLLCTFLI
jgi:hypothetical protein